MIDPITLIELTNLKASGQLKKLAAHPHLGMKPEWIEDLAQSASIWTRWELAKNPALANFPDVVERLASDKNPAVRSSLALNPALAEIPEIAAKLSKDKVPRVSHAIACNSAIPGRTATTQQWHTPLSTQKAPSI